MLFMNNTSWLLLSFTLPAKSQAIRVKVWRRLQALGAIQAKNSLYVLPASTAHAEHFTWLAKEVEEAKGEALFFETESIHNMDDQAIMSAFARDRDVEYTAIEEELQAALALVRGKELASIDRELLSTRRKCSRRLEAIRSRDFFPSGKGVRTAALLHEFSAILDGRDSEDTPVITTLRREDFVGKTWITRDRPYVDRLATIWAVRRFIDPDARLVFVAHDTRVDKRQDTVRFDMSEAEFTHLGGHITFEVLIASFGLTQEVPAGLIAMLRAIDLEEMDIAPAEAVGIKRVLDGLHLTLRDDDQLVAAALPIFDALSATYKQ